MLPKIIERTWFRPEKDTDSYSVEGIRKIVNNLPLPGQIRQNLQKEICEGLITRKIDSLYSNINKWLWDSYHFRFSAPEKKTDILERSITQVRETIIEMPVEVELDYKMKWKAGDFGDGGSCYFGCNAVTRVWLNQRDDFRVLKIYKNGKGFGRGLIIDEVVPECCVLYNTYPNHAQGSFLNYFSTAFMTVLSESVGEEIHGQICNIVVDGGRDWFYTNTGKGMLISFNKKALVNEVKFKAGNKPLMSSFKTNVGICECCKTKEVDEDNEYLLLRKLIGTKEHRFLLCARCTKDYIRTAGQHYNCSVCNDRHPYLSYIEAQVQDMMLKMVSNPIRRTNDLICTSCLNNNKDKGKYTGAIVNTLYPNLKKEKVLVAV